MKLMNARTHFVQICAAAVISLPVVGCSNFGESLEIPTVEEAEAEAADAIDESNLDEVLAELEAEIAAEEADG